MFQTIWVDVNDCPLNKKKSLSECVLSWNKTLSLMKLQSIE